MPKYPRNMVVTGGGNKNEYLLYLLKKLSCNIISNKELNIDGDFIESELIYLSARTFITYL